MRDALRFERPFRLVIFRACSLELGHGRLRKPVVFAIPPRIPKNGKKGISRKEVLDAAVEALHILL